MDKVKIKIIKPQEIFLEAEFDHIIIPGLDGDFGIYAGHTPFISVIRPGVMEMFDNDQITRYAIHDGYVTVEKDQVTILTELVEKASQIDVHRADAARQRAQERLKSNDTDIDHRRAEFALRKAFARLEVSRN
jgi:F-type H+-transporting ATPase subunit epsilon